MNILITGASGYIGSRLANKLAKIKNYNVICLARNPQNIQNKFEHLNVEIKQGDLLDSKSIINICENIDIAYYLVHSLSEKANFHKYEIECAQNFIKEASKSKIKKIIYLGGLGINKENGLSKHLRSRHEVGNILRSSNIPCIEFQASIIIGKGGISYEIMKSLVERLPAMITPKWVSSLSQPIWIEDVLSYLTISINNNYNSSKIVQIGGPDIISYKKLMQIYAKTIGVRRFMLSVPVLTPRLSSLWLGVVTPVYSRVGRKLIDSLTTDSIITDPLPSNSYPVKPINVEKSILLSLNNNNDIIESRWNDSISSSIPYSPKDKKSQYKYKYKDVREKFVLVDKEKAFEPINKIGGKNGWYFANTLWKIRGWIDLLIGGVGLRRERRDSKLFTIGDTLDWWRICDSTPNKMVKFESEMKLPGKAFLKFELLPKHNGVIIKQTATFITNKITGILYWKALFPIHVIVFKGMLSKIANKAIKYNQID